MKILNFNKFNKKSIPLSLAVMALVAVIFIKTNSIASPEIRLSSISPAGSERGEVIAASCGFGDNAAHYAGDTECAQTCPAGQILINGSCQNTSCANGAINPPTCNTCPSGQSLVNGRCVGQCTNGAINPGDCNQCDTPRFYWNGNACIPNPCGSVMPPSNYGQACGSGTNACGQANSSGTIQCDGRCNATSPNNNTCVQTFIPSTTSINPNGSVEFTWRALPGVGGLRPTCGFYDRSRGNGQGLGTPIPGLQNIDPTTDRIRINNIQRNTEFCLVCVYGAVGGVPQAPAAAHQWVRVIRVGEN